MKTAPLLPEENDEREEAVLAVDQISEIENWLGSVKQSLEEENISLGEIIDIQNVYDIIKEIY